MGLVVAFAAAGTAQAREFPVGDIYAGPVFAGPTVTWMGTERRGDRGYLHSAARDGSEHRRLGPMGGASGAIGLHGAPDGYAIDVVGYGPDSLVYADSVLEGSPGRPPREVASCTLFEPAGNTSGLAEADRGAGALLSLVRSCGGPPAQLEIRSPASAAEPVRRLNGSSGAVSGSFVVFARGEGRERELVVHNWRRDAFLYAVRTGDLSAESDLVDVEINERGTIAFLVGGLTSAAWTASVADPTPRRVPGVQSAGGGLDIHFAGDVLAYHRSLGRSGSEIGTYDLRTGRRHVTTVERSSGATVDTDGTSLTWWAYRCDGPVIRVAAVGETVARDRERCPLRLLERPVVRARTAVVLFGCSPIVRVDCVDRVTLRTADRRRRLLGAADAGARPYRGGYLVRVPLTRAGRRLLRRGRHRILVTVTVTPEYARTERRSARVTVRRGARTRSAS